MQFLLNAKEPSDVVLDFLDHTGVVHRTLAEGTVTDYDAVVLDQVTALDSAGRDLITAAIGADRAVVLLEPADEQKAVLTDVIGFGSAGPSALYVVVPCRDNVGGQHFRILEQRYPTQLVQLMHQEASGEGPGVTERGDVIELDLGGTPPEVPLEELKRFGKEVKDLLTSRPMTATAGAIPPNLKWKSWVYSQCQCWTARGASSKLGTPADQYISCQTTYEFDGFLNNWPETGPFQYLFLHQTGIFQTNGMAHNGDHTKGWYLTQLAPSFEVPSQLVYYQSSPPNVANKSSVTTTSGFSVNFSNEGAGASYDFSQSETREISEWEIIQLTGNSWRYAQASPYAGTTTTFPDNMVESNDKGELKGLPNISKYSLQFDVQSVWKTNALVTVPVTVKCSNYLRADYIITEYESGTAWSGYWWYSPAQWTPAYTINLGLLT